MSLRNCANTFLANLPDECWQGIRPHLHEVELPLGTILCEAGDEATNVHFPL